MKRDKISHYLCTHLNNSLWHSIWKPMDVYVWESMNSKLYRSTHDIIPSPVSDSVEISIRVNVSRHISKAYGYT